MYNMALIHIEKDEAAGTNKRVKMDDKGSCQGNRDKTMHGQVYPVQVPAGWADFSEKNVLH